MADLPSGTVTFLFTDIEGSTKLWEQHPDAMRIALVRHNALLRDAIEDHEGAVFKTVGDGFCSVFAQAVAAVAAACAIQRALSAEPWPIPSPLRVRVALHTGDADLQEGEYLGPPLNRVARLLEAGHGGQVLLSQATSDLVRETLPKRASLSDQGAHRLKDLQQPEHIFQILHPDLPGDFPSLRSLEAFAHNLPRQSTRFIGRERESAEVIHLLSTASLLTLTGSGGCGKTRLALQVAAEMVEEYADGVWFVELAALADPALVPQAVATPLRVREEPGRSLTDTLRDYLKPRSALLLLDNCEHLLGACAQLAETLMRGCPNLRILASSREGLGIAGEQTYSVPSLALPEAHTAGGRRSTALALTRYEAVQLFADRAALSLPTFAVTDANAPAVAQVCHRLDGIPLAIELAAVRVKVLSVEQIATRLDDRFRLLTGGSRTALPRQQTLRALIDWSYDLLSEPERALLRHLSVFAGGWTLEAAEAVCSGVQVLGCSGDQGTAATPLNTPLEQWQVLDLLTSLTEKSLVVVEQQAEARYRLLETVRQYARDRLLESGDGAAARGQHTNWYLALAERAEPELHGEHQATCLERLQVEYDNLRAALEWSLAGETGVEPALRLAVAMGLFWRTRGHLGEGRMWVARALDAAGNAFPELRGPLLVHAATLAMGQSDAAAVRSCCEASLGICRATGDQRAIATSLALLGVVADEEGDYASARSLYEQSLVLRQEVGSREEIAFALSNLGRVAMKQGDLPAARSQFESALAIAREMRHSAREASWLISLGHVARFEGNYAEARARYEEGLTLARGLGARGAVGSGILNLGLLLVKQGDYPAARAALEEGLRIWPEVGNKTFTVRCLEGMAQLAWAQGAPRRGARLFGAAEGQRETLQFPLPPVDRVDYECVPAIAAALGEAAFAAAWAEGRGMTLEEAAACALAETSADAGDPAPGSNTA
jgi:predicted ATPase/class 3 adenylate cyclase